MFRVREGRARDGLAAVGYTLLVALFYAPLLLGQRTFPAGDFIEQFLPFAVFQRAELLAGRLPLWNPYTFAGHPFLADVQAAVFYPISNLLLLLTAPWSSLAARLFWLEVEVALHVWLGAVFVYGLVRELTRQRAAAWLAGAAFAFSGYLTGYPPLQLSVLRTAVWLPLVLWCLWRGWARPNGWRWWVAAAIAYAVSFLAGHSQTFFFASQVVGAWLVLGFFLARGRAARAAYARRVAAFYSLALGLSAAQLLPSLEFVGLSVRTRVDYEFLSGGFPMRESWQLLLPGLLSVYSPLYVSVAGLGLALLALAATLRWLATARRAEPTGGLSRERAMVTLFFAGAALFFGLVAYGGEGFLYPLLYRWVPGWRLFRGQERAAFVVALSLCVLAGQGAALLPELAARARRLTGTVWAALVVGAVVLFWALGYGVGNTAFAPVAARGVLWAALFAALLWRGAWAVPQTLVLAGLVVADLLTSGVATRLEGVTLAERVQPSPAAVAVGAAAQEAGGVEPGLPGRVYNEGQLPPNYGMTVGVEDVWGSSPLRLARYSALFETLPTERLRRLTGVRDVLTWRGAVAEPSASLAEFPQGRFTTFLHRLAAPNPRAWVVNTFTKAEDADALRLLADPGFDPDSGAVVQMNAPGILQRQTGVLIPLGANCVAVQRHAPNRFTLQVESEQGGFLVLSENWMPGWQAWRQGENGGREAVPLARTNLSFLGMPVPPGTSTIEVVYWPSSVQFGLLVSGGTVVLLMALAWRHRQGRRRKEEGKGKATD